MENSAESLNLDGSGNTVSTQDKKAARGTLIREQLKYCSTILRNLKRHKDIYPFLNPVDPVAMGIPDYFNIIKNPMDMSLIAKKLDNCEYETPDQFIADFKLMLNNCYTYNGPESPISRMGKNVAKAFQSYLDKMPNEMTLAATPYVETEKKTTPKAHRKRRSSTAFSPKPVSTPSFKSSSKRNTVQEHIKFCQSVYREMTKQSNQTFAWPFMTPVDPVALGIPDYFTVIKEPMDLSTIKNKLDAKHYSNCEEFGRDVELIFNNCYAYNPPDSDVYAMAKKLEDVFRNKWKTKPQFVEDADPVHYETDDDDEESQAIRKMQAQIQTLQHQLSEMITSRRKRKEQERKNKKMKSNELVPMTYDEKVALSKDIGALPPEKLGKVIEIIHSNVPELKQRQEEDEIELEIDRLDTKTLRQLERYIEEVKLETGQNVQIEKYDSADDSDESDGI